MNFHLKYKNSFNFPQTLSFMRLRAINGVERVTDDSYSRTFRVENTQGFFTVRHNPAECALDLCIVCDDMECSCEIQNRVRRMFDLDTDFSAINARFAKDKLLSKGMENGHVPRLSIAFDPFELVIRAILGQQVTIKAATTLTGRIAEAAHIPTDATYLDGLDYFFPNPSELNKLDLDGLGMTKSRRDTVRAATQAVLTRAVKLTPNQTFDAFHKDFSALKGIGDWTVSYVAMRGLGMLDSFPASDLGVIKALTTGEKRASPKEILRMSDTWRPYRAYAALCLWNSLKTN